MDYDSDNIFARILRGELPCVELYEDEGTYAFMDIMPRADGHHLVIPKTAARNILDASRNQLAACMHTVQKLSRAAVRAFNADGVTLQQFSEAAGGQEVFHLHFHILPRRDGIELRPPGIMADTAVLREQATRIIDALN